MNIELSAYNQVSSATWTVPEFRTFCFGCSAGRDALSRHYRQGRRVHWNGFSSASSEMRVALRFAGVNGVLLRLTLLKAGSRSRDIHDLSAVTSEREVLSLQHSVTFRSVIHRTVESKELTRKYDIMYNITRK
jgi:hypothetical protein